MRFYEFSDEQPTNVVATVQSLLTYLRQRSNDNNMIAQISTHSFIEMVKRAGIESFNQESFQQIANDPAVSELIKSFNNDQIILKGLGDEEDEEEAEIEKPKAPNMEPEQTVDNMAKRAMMRRGPSSPTI